MAAGLAQCVVLVPSDVIKVNMQADDVDINGKRKYSGSLNCMFHILKTENIRGLYKGSIRIIHIFTHSVTYPRAGATVTVLREIPSIGIYFASYSSTKDTLQKAFSSKYSDLITVTAGRTRLHTHASTHALTHSLICSPTRRNKWDFMLGRALPH